MIIESETTSSRQDQDVLKCEGECGCTVHRYCAGVTKRQYASFNDGLNSPFICQWCSMKTAGATIQQLQSQVASLQAELAKTKEELAKQREQPRPSTYASAVVSTNMTANHPSNSARRRRQPQGQQRRSRRTQPTVSIRASAQPTRETSDSVTTDSSSSANRNNMQERVEVDGARKVWGTHPHATSKTVENAIVRFCQIQGLRVRRKTSTNDQSRRTSWWFVIHADESVLQELDQKWDTLNLQTNWILKRCTMPASAVAPTVNTSSHDNSDKDAANTTVDPEPLQTQPNPSSDSQPPANPGEREPGALQQQSLSQ